MQIAFNRYDGAADVPNVRRMPRKETRAHSAPRTIEELLFRLEAISKNEAAYRAQYPWAERFVLGYPLPAWQRPLVWADSQKTRFITSLWMELDVGTYLVNDVFESVTIDGREGTVFREFSDILLDGQQRLSALEDYFLGRIAAPDASGVLTYWPELGRAERRHFGNQTFSRAAVQSWDEAELRQMYDLRSFGGTPHTEEQRASVPLSISWP